jgi:hypothetical protein
MTASPSREAASYAVTYQLPSIYGTQKFITVLTRAFHWSLSCAEMVMMLRINSVFAGSVVLTGQDTTSCSLLNVYRRFVRKCRLHLQG